jgi:hypothetical protein
MDFGACDYHVRIPGNNNANEIITIRATPLDRVRDLINQLFAKYEFLKDYFNLTNFQTLDSTGPFLCLTPSFSKDGMVLTNSSYLKDCINPSQDVLALYEYPHVITVIMDDQARFLPSRPVLLDMKAPLFMMLPVLTNCFRVHKSACEFGCILTEKSDVQGIEMGQWLSMSDSLANYQFASTAMLGVLSSAWWKILPKSVIEQKAIKKGILKKDSSKNWISFEDQLLEKDWDDLPQANPKSRYFILAPPRLFYFASNLPDCAILEVISVDMFLIKKKQDSHINRIVLTRLNKFEKYISYSDPAKQSVKSIQNKMDKILANKPSNMTDLKQVVSEKGEKNMYILIASDEIPVDEQDVILSSWYLALGTCAMNTNEKKVFGGTLQSSTKNRDGIPSILWSCMNYLEQLGLQVEGIFRLSGSQQIINMIKDRINCDLHVDLFTIKNPHNVAGLMKLYLRDLADPLLTFKLYDDIMSIGKYEDRNLKTQILFDLINKELPDENLTALKSLGIKSLSGLSFSLCNLLLSL